MKALHRLAALGLAGLVAACSSSSDKPAQTKSQTARIVGFNATPTEVLDGDPTILAWEVENATQIRVEDGAGKVLVEARHPKGTVPAVPDRNQLYRLVATGKDGKEIQQQVAVQIRPGTAPAAEFRVEPAEVPIGSPIRLIWDTSETVGVVIRSGGEVIYESDRRLSGEVELIAEEAAIYTLTALGHWGKREIPAEVKVTPVILSFTAGTTEPVAKGSQTGLSWRTRGADELTIRTPEGQSWSVPPGDVDAGSMVLPLGTSGAFELVAKKGGFETVRDSQVAILGAPRIHSLEVSQPTVTQDEPRTVKVSWAVEFAQGGELTWDGNRHKITWLEIGEGSLDITVSDPTEIRLVATNSEATASTTANITTIPAPLPGLITPRHVGADEAFTLRWNAQGAVHVLLFRNGEPVDIAPDQIVGAVEQTVTGRTTYLLEARNAVGSVRTTTFVVEVGAPQILAFAGDRIRYGAGRPMAFSWEATGGNRIQVFDDEGQPIGGCDESQVGLKGTCSITAPSEFGTYTYLLEAWNAAGIASRALTFRVGDGPAVDRFEEDAAFVALGTDLTLSWIVLDDVDGTVPDITITDNRGGTWTFRGTHTEEGRLVLTAEESGAWDFEMAVTVPGKEPLIATASTVAVGTPTVEVTTDRPIFDVQAQQPIMLQWTANNASRIDVFATDPQGVPMGGPIHTTTDPAERRQGTLPVMPLGQGQGFLVVASNEVDETGEDIVFITSTPPENPILEFDVSAGNVPAGTPVTLNWSVWGFDSKTTLSPFLDGPPVEITASAPFINIRTTGTPVTMVKCGYPENWSVEDEGCQIINFPNGFRVPFDGIELTGVTVTANGAISTTLSTALLGTYSEQPFPTGNTNSRNFIQFGLLWDDISLSASDPIRYQLFDGPGGRHLVIQYSNVSSNTFQAVFWESGAVDYRYAAMSSTGSSRVIGWQDRDRTKGHNLNGSSAAVPGGLANRSWRWFEKAQTNGGSHTFTVNRTTIFTLCATTPAGRVCEKKTVTVQ